MSRSTILLCSVAVAGMQSPDVIGLLDAGIGLTWSATRFEVFGTNLTDQNKWQDPYHGWNNANRTRPRVVGLRVSRDFQ